MRLDMRAGLLLVALMLASFPVVSWCDTPPRDALQPWNPSLSSQGQPGYDARLDEPVKFWQPGITLAEVFASIRQQTGVTLGFFPADDENQRVRVHLFLNPGEPPSLRSLLVQLAWVTDCSFSEAEQDGQIAYYLMATSIARGADEGLKAREVQAHTEVAQTQRAVLDKLAELREALELPREEAIARYQGKDDRMLLGLLDPPHRAAAQIAVLRLLPWVGTLQMEPDEPPIYRGYGLGYTAGAMTPEEQAAWVTAFGIDPNGMEFQNDKVCFGAGVMSAGSAEVSCPTLLTATGGVENAGVYPTDRYTVLDLGREAALAPEEQITLRRELGEQISQADEKTFVDQRKKELAVAAEVAQVEASGAALTSQFSNALAGAALVLEPGKTYQAWQIEEAVARATGLSVVSDGLLYASAAAAPSGQARVLATLEALCSIPSRDFMHSPEWEWGDVGSFLRFRTSNRDVWRAAMLLQATVDWLDVEVRPFLPKPEESAKSVGFTLTIDPEQWTRQFARLSDLQMRYGARVLHGDPRDPAEVARHATWELASQYVQAGMLLLRFLGDMDSAQWELARAGTLRFPEDVTPDQGRALAQALAENVLVPPAANDYPHIRISLDEAELRQYPKTGASLVFWTYSSAGKGEGGGSYDVLVGAPPKACYRIKLSASPTEGASAEDARRFEKQVTFLPKTLTVEAQIP